MNIFIEPLSRNSSELASQSTKKKAKLNLYEFTFKQDTKLNLLKPRKQLFSYPTLNKQLQLSNRRQSEGKFYLGLQPQNQLLKDEKEKLLTLESVRYKSEHKLPALAKINFELNYKQDQQERLIRVNKQATKIKLGKMQGHFRQLNEKNQIVRVKQEDTKNNMNEIEEANTVQEKKDQLKERCYFIRNLIMNSVNLDAANQQRASLNILVNKVKETERRGKKSVHALDKKVEQHSPVSPVELRTNKISFWETAQTTLKQDIVKRYTKNMIKPQVKELKLGKRQEHLVSGWHITNNNFIQENQQFL